MKMKNMGIASVICMLFALPSYADIASGANNATCNSDTIGATEGSTDLEANWNANSITINWYNGNTKITTNTCSYDGAVTIPATPTKAGYTFNGWHVRVVKQCWDISDFEECNATTGCVMTYNGCRVEVESCGDIENATECGHSSPGGGFCYWSAGVCMLEMSGGSN